MSDEDSGVCSVEVVDGDYNTAALATRCRLIEARVGGTVSSRNVIPKRTILHGWLEDDIGSDIIQRSRSALR